jgi:hypothetical protein
MDSDYGPPRVGWYGGPRRSNWSDPNMRVSDAERTEIADTLSKHYADGRLDDGEFKVRLDKAMASKTRGDLSGLLADLPSLHPETTRQKRPGIARRTIWAMTVFAMVVLAIGVATAFTTPHIPWLLVIVVFALLWHRRHGRYHHHHALSD